MVEILFSLIFAFDSSRTQRPHELSGHHITLGSQVCRPRCTAVGHRGGPGRRTRSEMRQAGGNPEGYRGRMTAADMRSPCARGAASRDGGRQIRWLPVWIRLPRRAARGPGSGRARDA